MELLRRGIRPVIVEGVGFPRFSIGESLTGECGKLLRDLGLEDAMNALDFPVKRGVEVWGAGGRNAFYVSVQSRGPEGLQPATTWQVLRSAFDQSLLSAAEARGATVVRATAREVIREQGRVAGVVAELPGGTRLEINARVVVDASGRATFLANRGVTGPKTEGAYGRQIAIFAHVRGATLAPGERSGDTLIFYRAKHEWGWLIPVSPDVTSLGIVLPVEQFKAARTLPEPFFTQQILELNPALTERIQHATRCTAVRTVANYSYATTDFAGPGFVCIGDAHRFTDPIFSFGVYMTMREASMAAETIAETLGADDSVASQRFARFMHAADSAQDIVASVVDVFWGYPLAFQRMAHRSHQDGITDIFAGRFECSSAESAQTVEALRHLQSVVRGDR